MTFKKCRNEGCEIMIEVRNTAEGWRPYEESGNKHNCQFSEYAKKQRTIQEEQKNDHGNELVQNTSADAISNKSGTVLGYVDHTIVTAKPSKCRIFFSNFAPDVEKDYEEFQAGKKFAWARAQSHVTKQDDDEGGMLFTIFLYYEEIKQ